MATSWSYDDSATAAAKLRRQQSRCVISISNGCGNDNSCSGSSLYSGVGDGNSVSSDGDDSVLFSSSAAASASAAAAGGWVDDDVCQTFRRAGTGDELINDGKFATMRAGHRPLNYKWMSMVSPLEHLLVYHAAISTRVAEELERRTDETTSTGTRCN